MIRSNERVFKALVRDGIAVRKDGPVFRIRNVDSPHAPEAEVLLPEGFALESKAVAQLASFAAVRHPSGGEVKAAFATPDFLPGAIVPVGAVVATSADMVIPQAIGTDIQCGMRLHVCDISVEQFLQRKEEFVALVKGDLLLGTRDVPMHVSSMRALFDGGCVSWLDEVRMQPLGRLQMSSMRQLAAELDRVYGMGSYDGSSKWAPSSMLPSSRDIVRDPSLATIGGGNHFVEVQVVEAVLDRSQAFAWGVKEGQLAFMIHSGSRLAGVAIGNAWIERAKREWPEGLAHPESGIYPLYGDLVDEYLEAMNSASNYASVNRLLLAELVRLRLREVFGADVEAPLLFDVPHNIVLKERGLLVHRKGATPAHCGQPVLVPGSMGHSSFLMVGQGNERFLHSASHGAGRLKTRYEMRHKKRANDDLGFAADVGIASIVARMRPLLTFKA